MPTLSIRFIGGHYHATPWGRAQNEGAVEWPPSPWRVLRALLATGYAKLPEWRDGLVPDAAKSLVGKLASRLPVYRLPPAIGAHTRHYMPVKGSTTLVIDARAVTGVGHDPLLIRWDVALDAEETALLAALAERLGYLGRAESWTEARLVEDAPAPDAAWCRPVDEACPAAGAEGEVATLLAPFSPTEYARWREAAALSSGLAKKKFDATHPVDLLAALQVESGWLQKQGWTTPPGTRFVRYRIPAGNALGTTPPPARRRLEPERVEFALLALSCSARSRTPLPLASRTLPQADLLHRAIASFVGKRVPEQAEVAARELLGLDANREPLTGHRHAHILPLSLLNADNHLDHMLVWAPGGMGGVSQDILRRLRRTYMKGGVGELAVRFSGAGSRDAFQKVQGLRGVLSPARVWQSLTPLVLPRHRKRRGKNTLEGQIAAECATRGLPAPERIEVLEEESIAFRHYVRRRARVAPPPEDFGYALRLAFPEPVAGPLCLGYASHFGLGLFGPC